MAAPPDPSTRIFGVSARAAPRVVLIRRGPTKHVLLLTWDTRKHEFHAGQWFKGRIYEERCDLSPQGDKLIYLAANHKGDLQSWTTVSRPPFLTALALWPNMGTWGGGGLFESDRVIAINSCYPAVTPRSGVRIPKGIRVVPIARWAGRGEDDPIRTLRMKRDGWELADAGETKVYRTTKPYSWEFERPERWRKRRGNLILERRLLGIHEINGPWYAREHYLLDGQENILLALGRSDWADWSQSGELLFAREGRVHRVVIGAGGAPGEPDELIDLRALRFEEVPPPPDALSWSSKVVGKRIR
jgi:hypothetical protein